MSKKTTLLTVVVAAVLLLAVIAIAMNAPDRSTTDKPVTETSDATEQTTPSTEETTSGDEQKVVATIVYTDNGFEPSSVTVKAGDTVRVENKSSMPLSFNSDDHPSHTKQSELNVGDVPRGGSRDFTVTKTGTWGFHNHENASDTGELIVE